MKISNRERYRGIAKFQRPGDLFTSELLWPGLLPIWVEQGAPKEFLEKSEEQGFYTDNPFMRYFKHSPKRIIHEVKSGLEGSGTIDIGNGFSTVDGCPLVPGYKGRIVSQEGQNITYTNGVGQTLKAIRGSFSMPQFIDWPVKDRATWKEHKKRLDPTTPERWPADWDAFVKAVNSEENPVILEVGGFYGYLREWIGSERILYMFYDDPVLIEDMMEQVLYMEMEIIKRVVKDIKVDQADFWEDICYKAGLFISPDMVRKFMIPRYKKITELLRDNGVDIIYVDSDGNIEQMIPLWLEAGINMVWPLEQTAGNDPIAYRKKYGKDLILSGGIDKRALIKGKEAIKAEVMSKVPYLLKEGGFFPTVDHVVPPEVSFENYRYYINLLREIAGLEKVPC